MTTADPRYWRSVSFEFHLFLLTAAGFAAGTVAFALVGEAHPLSQGIIYLTTALGIGTALAYFAAFYGLLNDIRFVRAQRVRWQPSGTWWLLGHLATGPLAAGLYLRRRRRVVGLDYQQTLLGRLPWTYSTPLRLEESDARRPSEF